MRQPPFLWLRAFLALGFTYGWRKSEMLDLKVYQVDLLRGWLYLDDSKNGEGRKVKLTEEVRTLLAACVGGKEPDDFLLTHEDGEDGSRVAQPRKNWYALCDRAGLGKLTKTGTGRKKRLHYEGLQMHDLRRSGVRQMRRRGIAETVAMKISGHKTRSIFDRYDITSERDLENAAKLMEGGTGSETGAQTDTKTDTLVVAHS